VTRDSYRSARFQVAIDVMRAAVTNHYPPFSQKTRDYLRTARLDRRHCIPCAYIGATAWQLNGTVKTLSRGCKAARQKFAAMAQPFLVDAVADALREVPLDRDAERGETVPGMSERLRRDEIVLIAVDQ
jgi:hypothetical protein